MLFYAVFIPKWFVFWLSFRGSVITYSLFACSITIESITDKRRARFSWGRNALWWRMLTTLIHFILFFLSFLWFLFQFAWQFALLLLEIWLSSFFFYSHLIITSFFTLVLLCFLLHIFLSTRIMAVFCFTNSVGKCHQTCLQNKPNGLASIEMGNCLWTSTIKLSLCCINYN